MLFTTNYRMRNTLLTIFAALTCCISCIEVDDTLGSELISESNKYTVIPAQSFPLQVKMCHTDSLSGYSSLRMSIGAIRDKDFGLSKRSCAFTLVPLDTLNFGDKGTTPEFVSFHFAAAYDTISVDDKDEAYIFQSANVYALKEPLNIKRDYDCNGDISSKVDFSKRISLSRPILNGSDSLSFDFTEDFGKRFFSITDEEKTDIDKYLKHFPGVYITVDDPVGIGGRFNHYELQLGFDADYYYITGNYASLHYKGTFDGVRKDTAAFFYYSPNDFYSADTLVSRGIGSLPQYCLNLTGLDKTSPAYNPLNKERLYVEGGGGLKPVIDATQLRREAMKIIRDTLLSHGMNLSDTSKVIVTKASLIFSYEAPDSRFKGMFKYADMMSPIVRTHYTDTTGGVSTNMVSYANISDYSSETENQGTINTSLMRYSPDITYHLQEILGIDFSSTTTAGKEKIRKFKNGEYDIWLMNMAYESITTTTTTSDEMSDYYQYLAYQSYYNSIYGGSSGYSSYGDPYSNYYSYMLASMYASGSSTSTSTELKLDTDRYYKTVLFGPDYFDSKLRPRFEFSFVFPNR